MQPHKPAPEGGNGTEVEQEAIRSGDNVYLKTHNGSYVGIRNGEVEAVSSVKEQRNVFNVHVKGESFKSTVEVASGTIIFLTAYTGKRITVQGGTHNTVPDTPSDTVHAYWDHMASWQNLVVEKTSGNGTIRSMDEIMLEGHTAKRLTFDGASVRASAGAGLADLQTLTIERIPEGAPALLERLPMTPPTAAPSSRRRRRSASRATAAALRELVSSGGGAGGALV